MLLTFTSKNFVIAVNGEAEKQIYDEYLAPDDVWTEDAPKIRRISDCYFERLDVDGKMQFAMAALCIITLDKDMLKKGRAAFYKLWQNNRLYMTINIQR